MARGIGWALAGVLAGVLSLLFVAAIALSVAYPNLPDIDSLLDYRPKLPMRVYSSDGVLLGEYGEERRNFVGIRQIPKVMQDAVLSIEDARFYQHGGVDYLGVIRAGLAQFNEAKSQGASTITMQVARNFYLSSEKTFTRKIYEILLALKIESLLTKEQILEVYMNQIYLGQRAYGFAAASEVYFGKPLKDITVAEAAMLAGLPKAPSAYNPIANPKRATVRQQYIIERMLDNGFITAEQFEAARAREAALPAALGHGRACRVRRRDGAPAGLRPVRRRVLYARPERPPHGARGRPAGRVPGAAPRAARLRAPAGVPRPGGLRRPAEPIRLPSTRASPRRWPTIPTTTNCARPSCSRPRRRRSSRCCSRASRSPSPAMASFPVTSGLSQKAEPKKQIRRGAVVRAVQGCQGRLDAHAAAGGRRRAGRRSIRVTGAIRALVGGFDYRKSKFNHVTQAWRQPGSSFKPFIYSAALEKGFTPATVVNDAPLFFDAGVTGSQPWEPKNYDGTFDGPDVAAPCAREVEEHGVDPRPAGDRPRLRAAMGAAASASSRTSTPPT